MAKVHVMVILVLDAHELFAAPASQKPRAMALPPFLFC